MGPVIGPLDGFICGIFSTLDMENWLLGFWELWLDIGVISLISMGLCMECL